MVPRQNERRERSLDLRDPLRGGRGHQGPPRVLLRSGRYDRNPVLSGSFTERPRSPHPLQGSRLIFAAFQTCSDTGKWRGSEGQWVDWRIVFAMPRLTRSATITQSTRCELADLLREVGLEPESGGGAHLAGRPRAFCWSEICGAGRYEP